MRNAIYEHETCNKGNPIANLGVQGISLQFQVRALTEIYQRVTRISKAAAVLSLGH